MSSDAVKVYLPLKFDAKADKTLGEAKALALSNVAVDIYKDQDWKKWSSIDFKPLYTKGIISL